MDTVIILGEFNACVGKDGKSWPNVIGKRGAGKMNSSSLMLLEFCTRFQLSIIFTMFQLRDSLARSIEQQTASLITSSSCLSLLHQEEEESYKTS